jgi:thymidylate synthase
MRSNDAVFGFDNDSLWHQYVQNKLANDLSEFIKKNIICDNIIWNAGSLHIYERHFKYLDELINKEQ